MLFIEINVSISKFEVVMNKYNITFLESGKKLSVNEGSILSKACEEAGYIQDLVCGGNGKCGKCLVQIIVDGVYLSVLSCEYKVKCDLVVAKTNNLINNNVRVLTEGAEFNLTIKPKLKVLTVRTSDIVADHCLSTADKVKLKYELDFSYEALEKFSRNMSSYDESSEIEFICYDRRIIDIRESKDEPIYALAIDVGTTTVAMYLYDMREQRLVKVQSTLNMQSAHGADIISRIGYCINNKDGVGELKELIANSINDLLNEANQNDGVNLNYIYNVVLCGNSAMQNLFFGYYPESLSKAPFACDSLDLVETDGSKTLLNVSENAIITFLPLLGGFVGADTTAVLLALPKDKKTRLMIDLGTNGEIAIGDTERYIVASTACGPALEGAGITFGMRASLGAVDSFKIDENKNIIMTTIQDGKPIGICGSAIIDILAQLIKHNVFNRRGRMITRKDYEKKFGEDNISRRLERTPEQNVFVLCTKEESGTGEAIYFGQKDARQVQLAKSAIATGCLILIDKYAVKPTDLEEICLAGAFGNYLDTANAQLLGLLPNIEGVNVRSIGNGAGTGVQMYLLNEDMAEECNHIKANTTHLELNFQEEFKDTYFDEMLFKNANY